MSQAGGFPRRQRRLFQQNPGCPDRTGPRVTKQEEIPHQLLRDTGAGQRRDEGRHILCPGAGKAGSSDIRVKTLLGDSRKRTQKVSRKIQRGVQKFALQDLLDKAGKSDDLPEDN